MVTLPLSVAPSSTVRRATLTSPLRRPEPPSRRRRLAVTLPLTWPRTLTFAPSIVAWTLAVLSTDTSPLALSSPSTLPWILRSPWISSRPCRLSRGPRLTTLLPPFWVVPGEWVPDFSAWAMWASSTGLIDVSIVLLNSDDEFNVRLDVKASELRIGRASIVAGCSQGQRKGRLPRFLGAQTPARNCFHGLDGP